MAGDLARAEVAGAGRRAERWRFWGLTITLVLVAWGAVRALAPGRMLAGAIFISAPTVAFFVTGVLSTWRRRSRRP